MTALITAPADLEIERPSGGETIEQKQSSMDAENVGKAIAALYVSWTTTSADASTSSSLRSESFTKTR